MIFFMIQFHKNVITKVAESVEKLRETTSDEARVSIVWRPCFCSTSQMMIEALLPISDEASQRLQGETARFWTIFR